MFNLLIIVLLVFAILALSVSERAIPTAQAAVTVVDSIQVDFIQGDHHV